MILTRLLSNRFLQSIWLCLIIVFVFSFLLRVNLPKNLYEMNYSDPVWESLDAKYFATTGNFDFSFRSYPSEFILMPHFAKTHFLIHSYAIGLLGYISKIDIPLLWNIYGLIFYIIGMGSLFYLLWSHYSLFTAFVAVTIGFFNNAFLPFLFYSLADNTQIATFTFLMIFTLLSLNKHFIFIFLLYIFTLLTSFSIGSSVMLFLIIFYALSFAVALKERNLKSARKFLSYILSVCFVTLIIYSLIYNNLITPYLKTVIINTRLDAIDFMNLGFLYILGSIVGTFIFLKDNFRKYEFCQQKLLLITSLFLLASYFIGLFLLRVLGMNIDVRIWNILCIRYQVYTLPLIFLIGYCTHYCASRKGIAGYSKLVRYFFILIIVLSAQMASYVYNNVRLNHGNKVAFRYIIEKLKKNIGVRYEIPIVSQPKERTYIYKHKIDKDFYKTKLGISYYPNFSIERKIASMITDNYKNFDKKIIVNSSANGAKIALYSGCTVLSEYITPQAWRTIFITDDNRATYNILNNTDKFRSRYISDFENYFYLPQVVDSLPSSKKKYGKVDFIVFYYRKSLNLKKGLKKFLDNPQDYKLIKEYQIGFNQNFNDREEKVLIFQVI